MSRQLPAHIEREGFRMLGAFADDRLAGFAYGYHGAPGQWWYERVAAALDRNGRTRWLGDGYFELVELAVDPEFQRRGIGGRLHDTLLEPERGPALLSTQVDNGPARRLYFGRGWELVVPALRFARGGGAYSVLGLPRSRLPRLVTPGAGVVAAGE
ncbi:MAG TPA: GNAT family N-acetyltransferase [Gaiellaceae bacterium]